MKVITAVLILLLSAQALAQDVRQSLIVAHVDPGSGSQFRQQLVAYHFLNGSFTGREELMTVAGRKDGKDYVRTDLGSNVLYKDRYLVTGIGNIIDLTEKKILFDGRASLVRCSNDSAVFYTNDIFKGKFYSVYDFKKGQYAEVTDLLFKAKAGEDVEFDKTAAPFRLYLYPQGKPKVLVSDDMGFGQQGTGESHVPDPPLFWTSRSEVVYAHFNKANTELSVYKLAMGSNRKTLLGTVVIVPEKKPAVITRIDANGLLLQLGMQQIFIDLKAETAALLVYTKPSNGFSYECSGTAAGRAVKLNEKEVGRFHFRTSDFKTEKNIAAFVKEISVGAEIYQQGLAVWNDGSKKWAAVDAEEVLVIVGWINR